jgi:selenide,water dikinase
VAAVVDSRSVPLLPGALELAEAGHVPGGTRRNLADLAVDVSWAAGVPESLRILLADAQTSGGLLMAVPLEKLQALVGRLSSAGTPASAVIGEVVEGSPGTITVR